MDADEEGAAQRGLRRVAQLRVVNFGWKATTTTSARLANVVPLTIRSPAASTWRCSALEPMTTAAPAVEALGEQELQRAAGRDDLLERGLEAQAPELAHVLLGRSCGVVRDERDVLARRAQGRDRRDRASVGSSPTPDAAVEIEQDVVVAGDERGDLHDREFDYPSVACGVPPS